MKDRKSSTIWGGRFSQGPAAIMERINASIDFDKRLYAQDIQGSQAHAQMLAAQGIISAEDNTAIQKGLSQIKEEIESGQFNFQTALEDIHMNIESRLAEIIGKPAGRLHTARSRNDQVALDFRLWVRDATDNTIALLKTLLKVLLDRADEHYNTIMPGFTHLQTAQPVTLGHHFMAYVEMFGRDLGRFADARERLNQCPLGAAALAGTSFPIDRHMVAASLGFKEPVGNSLDAVSSRDFALEVLGAASICAMHLSRLAEELVIWTSSQFRFVNLSDAFTTGSSIMPQKRNPDAAELIRAKIGRIMGSFTALLMVMKGLPLAYGKDMQEDKEPTFEAFDALELSLAAMTGMLEDISFNKERLRENAGTGYANATDLADWLVQKLNIPFREAHHITGRIVKLAENKGCNLEELSLGEMQAVEAGINPEIFSVLGVARSVESRVSFGGTAPSRVKEAIAQARLKFLA